MKIVLAFLLLLIAGQYCHAQWQLGQRAFSHGSGGGGATFTKDGTGCSNTANPVSGTTLTCTLTQTVGDLITVEFSERNGLFSTISDPTNGTYSNVYYAFNPNDPGWAGQAYFLSNAAATGNLTLTMNTSTAGDTWGNIHAQAWKVSSGTASLDAPFSTTPSTFFQVSAGAINGDCGTARTPSGNNELIVSYIVPDGATPTAGSGFTLANQITTGSNPAWPEYQIQTTTTATNGPFVMATDDWIVGCAAFIP